jgi:uncharacterized protein (DUF2062 family)
MRFFRKLRRKLPKKQDIQNQPSLSMFRSFWKRSELWAMNRTSLSRGISIGLFCAFLPMPFEMVVAVFLAIMLGGNLIFASTLVWISNPVTWIPLYTPCYLLGAKILQVDPIDIHEITSLKNIFHLGYHYAALWTGCLIVGSIIAFSTYFLISVFWRIQVKSEWQERKLKRSLRKKATTKN